jgi:hypothetical protein
VARAAVARAAAVAAEAAAEAAVATRIPLDVLTIARQAVA